MIRAAAAVVALVCAGCGGSSSAPDLATAVTDADHVVAHSGAFWTPSSRAVADAPTECTFASVRAAPAGLNAQDAAHGATELANRVVAVGLAAAHLPRVKRLDPAELAATLAAPADSVPLLFHGPLYRGNVDPSSACDTAERHPRATCTIAGRHRDIDWQLDWYAYATAPLADAQLRCERLEGRWTVR